MPFSLPEPSPSLPFRPLAALASGAVGGLVLLAREALFPTQSAFEVAAERAAADVLSPGERIPAVRVAVPLAVGAVFAIGYAKLWAKGRCGPDWGGVALLGAVHGLLTVPAEPLLRTVHSEEYDDFPPAATWVPGLVVDHLVFAFATAGAYRLLASFSA